MKRHYYLLSVCLLAFVMGCAKSHNVDGSLTDHQVFLLTVPGSGDTLTFNENGQLFKVVVAAYSRDYETVEEVKAPGSYTEGTTYYRSENGLVYYDSLNKAAYQFTINVKGRDPYRNISGFQNINICDKKGWHGFSLSFDSLLTSKTIGGVSYGNVAVGLSTTGDSLFYKETLGILGWKVNGSSYIVYRIF